MRNFLSDLIRSRDYSFWYNYYLLCLMLVAVTMPFSLKLNNIAIGALLLGWILSGDYLVKLRKIFSSKLLLLFISLYLIQLVGLLYTENLVDGLQKIETKAALLVLPLIIGSSFTLQLRHVYWVTAAFVVACTAMAAHGFSSIIWGFNLQQVRGLTEYIDEAIEMHHAYSGMYLVFAVYAALYLSYVWRRLRWQRFGMLAIALVLYVFLIILAARTALFTSILLLLAGAVYGAFKNMKQLLIGIGLIFLVVAGIALALPNTKNKIEEFAKLKGVHNPMTPRLIKWKCSFKIIDEQNAWAWGVGTGDVQTHLQACYAEEKFWGELYFLNAHNEFLEGMLRHGLPGAILLLMALLYPMGLSVSRKKLLYLIFLIVFVMSSLTESTLSRQKGVVFYSFFNAILAFSYLRPTNEDEEQTLN